MGCTVMPPITIISKKELKNIIYTHSSNKKKRIHRSGCGFICPKINGFEAHKVTVHELSFYTCDTRGRIGIAQRQLWQNTKEHFHDKKFRAMCHIQDCTYDED